MPVSTRSQINSSSSHGQNEPNSEQRIRRSRLTTINQEDSANHHLPLKNPHHGLKEKMKALTLLYEQQKQASLALKNSSFKHEENSKLTSHPSVDLLGSDPSKNPKPHNNNNVMRENTIPTIPNPNITRTFVLPHPAPAAEEDSKENLVGVGIGRNSDQIFGFTCPRKGATVARKLSLGAATAAPPPPAAETEKIGKIGNRILVFVRLRPMGKKEKEAGSRCCVRIVNRREVYLTEFASENDYLRLNRLRGRHFTFDASFPDSASQQEVYSTT